MRYPRCTSLSLAVSLASTQLAYGASPVTEANDIEQVLVRGAYFGQQVASGAKTPTLLVNVPQSISIMSADQIQDQAMTSIAEVMQYTPGVSIGQGEDHRDQITLRGQNTTADFFVDGLRDDVQYFRPLYNLERVEILRGSNALLFGRGGGGGVQRRCALVGRHAQWGPLPARPRARRRRPTSCSLEALPGSGLGRLPRTWHACGCRPMRCSL